MALSIEEEIRRILRRKNATEDLTVLALTNLLKSRINMVKLEYSLKNKEKTVDERKRDRLKQELKLKGNQPKRML